MQECGGSRLDDSAYAEQDKHEVEADDETVVAVDARHERSAELTQGDELIEIACRNGDVRDLSGNGGAGIDGNADACFGQRRRIVHAVADHDNGAAHFFFAADEVRLILRQHFGVELIHADLCCNGFGGLAVIAGHHDNLLDAASVQSADGVLCFLTQRVGDTDDGCEHTGNAQIKVRILGRKCVELRFFALRDHAALVFKNEVRAADDDLFALHSAGNAVRDDVFHARMVLFVGEAAFLGFGHDSVCHGVRVMLLKAGGKAQHFAFLTVAERFDHGDTRCCVRQRAGFIEHNGIGVCNGLHEAAALDGNMVCAALAHRRQHRDRHGEL